MGEVESVNDLAGFTLEESSGSAADFHSRPIDFGPVPSWHRLSVTAPAVVLGSAQPDSAVDSEAAAAAGVEVVRRRSGGGAVWLDADSFWFDVTIGRSDPRWNIDVGRAFNWIGALFVRSLRHLGIEAEAHTGKLVDLGWSKLVCFGGIGSGEVVVDNRKLVGISQRRTRDRSRFQVVFYRSYDAAPLLEVLALSRDERYRAGVALRTAGVGCDALGIEPDDLLGELVSENS